MTHITPPPAPGHPSHDARATAPEYGAQPPAGHAYPAPPPGGPGYGVVHGSVHTQASSESDKSFVATWLLSWLLGALGVDRFYLGKVGTGLIKLFTFGGLGVWWLIDLILVLAGAMRDKYGRPLASYRQHRKIAWIVTGAVVLLSMIVNAINLGTASSAPTTEPRPVVEAPLDEATGESTESDEDAAAQPPAPAPAEDAEPAASGWADREFGTFAPETHTGAGDDLITLPAGATAGLVTASHSGSSNFAVNVLDAENASTGDLLVNEIGSYEGTTAFGLNSFGEGVTLEIMADGEWTVTIAPFSSAPALGATAAGSGDTVFLYDGSAGKLTATHDGDSNFVVIEENGKAFSWGLLINEIGSYTGTVPLGAGPSVVAINADGNWTLEVS